MQQFVGTAFSDAVLQEFVGAAFSDAVLQELVGAAFGNTFFQQAIRTTFGHTILDQAIGTTLGHTAFNQTIRAAFSDHRLSRVCGESVNCENRESDAEEGLAFHDGVLRGAYGLVWSRCYAGDFLRELH
ncbi:hypothetical protein D3C75_1166180 [compost metagenome]